MKRSVTARSHVLSLTVAFLLSGLVGCSGGSEAQKPPAADAKPAASAAAPQAQTPPGAPTTGTPGAPGLTPLGPKVDPATLPAVVAKIDGKEIKKDEFLEEAQQIRQQFLQRGAPADQFDTQAFYHQVLDGIIARNLLETAASTSGVTVTDADLQKEVDQLKKQFPKPEDFDKAMAAQGMSEAVLKGNLKRQLVIKKFIDSKVAGAAVTDAAEKDFYDKNQDKMKQPERLHLRHILIKVDEKAADADKAKAKTKADGLLAQIKSGGDFAKLAGESSDDPGSKANGGDLSWITAGQTVEPFEKAAFALKTPNELSPVVETRFGYHIIQLLERQGASTVPFEQVKERIGAVLKQKQTQEAVQARIQELRAKAKVETFI